VRTVQAALAEMKAQFTAAGIDSADTDARLLMQAVLKLSREDLFMNSSLLIPDAREMVLKEYAARRLKREPVSRILGTRSFWKSDFKISRETLDPRADSEVLIETALKHIKNPMRVLDLGTGSGCLLLSLLQEWSESSGIGVDISADAVRTAEENARAMGLAGRAKFVAADWNALPPGELFDVVISNPPYIAEHEMAGLEPEVTLYDPRRALVSGPDGLECYRSIISLLPRFLKKQGHVFFEVGHSQAGAVKDMLEAAGLPVLQTAPDLAGHDRCIAALKP